MTPEGATRRSKSGFLSRIWEQHARSYDPVVLVNEAHPVKAVLPVLAGASLVLLAMYYVPAARDFTGIDRPWIPMSLLTAAGAITIVEWRYWERSGLTRVLILLDNCLYCLAIVAVMLDTTSPTRYVWGLLYAQAATHYGDRYSFSWPMFLSVVVVPCAVTLGFADYDYGLLALMLFGGVMFVVRSTSTEHVRRLEREKERYRSAYEISDRVATESIDIALATSLAEFGNFAHELRNALTPVHGNLIILREHENLHPDIKDSVESLDRSYVRINEFIEKLLWSIKSKATVSDTSFEIDEVLDQEIITRGLFPGDRSKVRIEEMSIPFEVKGNPEHLIGAIRNLVQNALNAGASNVTVSATVGGALRSASILISDDGPGLSTEVANNLFQSGLQSKKGRSHGLGLPLSKRLVEVLGGDLRLVEQGPTGTTFEILLPGRGLLQPTDEVLK